MAQRRGICEQSRDRQQQQVEPDVVVATDTVVDPDAVVVLLLHTGFTQRAVLRPCRFREPARAAIVAWVEETVVVGVSQHCLPVACRRDVRTRSRRQV